MTVTATGQTQPWNRVVFPPSESTGSPGSWAWGRWHGWVTPEVARSLPGVGRALSLITGQAQQMPLDDYRGVEVLPRPRLLEAPDPDQSRAWFVGVQWEDYLLNGNALHVVTTRNRDGWPETVAWVPAAWCAITVDPSTQDVDYWVGGTRLNRADVVHVKRGADRNNPHRGVGVVEQHLDALAIVRDQHRYESDVLAGAAVPSVAVIAPNPRLSSDEAKAAKVDWVEKYGGPTREPAILPAGTQVIPLAWSPSDSQLVEARTLSLTDTANMFNLDGYWLGAPAGSHTYRTPGPMWLNLLRQTIEPVAQVFEDVWSAAWVPRGRRVRHDRRAVLRDDMATMVTTARAAVDGGLWTVEEARVFLGLSPALPEGTLRGVTTTSPVATVPNETDDADQEAQP